LFKVPVRRRRFDNVDTLGLYFIDYMTRRRAHGAGHRPLGDPACKQPR